MNNDVQLMRNVIKNKEGNRLDIEAKADEFANDMNMYSKEHNIDLPKFDNLNVAQFLNDNFNVCIACDYIDSLKEQNDFHLHDKSEDEVNKHIDEVNNNDGNLLYMYLEPDSKALTYNDLLDITSDDNQHIYTELTSTM